MTGSDDKTIPPDPFAVLEIGEDADDETIQRRYLALVRRYPPERDPDRFREIRAAYEAIQNKRDRLRARLLSIHDAALLRLKRLCLGEPGEPGRPGRNTVNALLREGADRLWAESILPHPES
jgi:curved DNA-binding protein CbpA